MIPFGEWRPDEYDLNAQVAGEASGVLPGSTSYEPWPSLVAASNALTGACRGATLARTNTGGYNVYANTGTKAYRFATASSWTDVTNVGGDYTIAADIQAQYVQLGANLIMTNGADNLQYIDVDVGTNFVDVGGSPPIAYYARAIGNFLFLGSLSTDRNGIIWSGLGDITTWVDGEKSSGSRSFPDGGFVTGIAGFPDGGGLVFQTGAIRLFERIDSRAVFSFRQIEGQQGMVAPYSLVTWRGTSFYYGLNGFAMIGTDGVSIPIGLKVVDKWFNRTCSQDRLQTICGALDPVSPRVFWLFPDVSNPVSTTFDHIICYDILLKKWSHADVQAELIFAGATLQITLEGLDAIYASLESIPYSLDSAIWQGGAPNLGGFDDSHRLGFFSGGNMAAVVQTGLFEPMPGQRAFTNGFRILTDSANATGRVGVTEKPPTTVTWSSNGSMNDQGLVNRRASGRFFRIETTVAANESWTHLQGVSQDDPDLMIADGEA